LLFSLQTTGLGNYTRANASVEPEIFALLARAGREIKNAALKRQLRRRHRSPGQGMWN